MTSFANQVSLLTQKLKEHCKVEYQIKTFSGQTHGFVHRKREDCSPEDKPYIDEARRNLLEWLNKYVQPQPRANFLQIALFRKCALTCLDRFTFTLQKINQGILKFIVSFETQIKKEKLMYEILSFLTCAPNKIFNNRSVPKEFGQQSNILTISKKPRGPQGTRDQVWPSWP